MNLEKLEKVIGDFAMTETVGYIDVNTHLLEEEDELDKRLVIEICDGYNHTWYEREYGENSNLTNVIDGLEDYDPYEDFELIIKNEVPEKPCTYTLIGIVQDVEETITKLIRYLENIEEEI